MRTRIQAERDRRTGITIERLRSTANTAAEVLAGKYPEDTVGYLLGALETLQADLRGLSGRRSTGPVAT